MSTNWKIPVPQDYAPITNEDFDAHTISPDYEYEDTREGPTTTIPKMVHPFGTASSDVNQFQAIYLTDAAKLVEELWGPEARKQWEEGVNRGK